MARTLHDISKTAASALAAVAIGFVLIACPLASCAPAPQADTESQREAPALQADGHVQPQADPFQVAEGRTVSESDCGSEYLPLTYVEGSLNNLPNSGNYQGLASDGAEFLYQVTQNDGADVRVFRLGAQGGNPAWMTYGGDEALDVRIDGERASLHANGACFVDGGYLAMTGAGGIVAFHVDGTELEDPKVLTFHESGEPKPTPSGVAFDADRRLLYVNFGRDLYGFEAAELDRDGADEGVSVNGVPVGSVTVDLAGRRLAVLEDADGAVGVQGIAYHDGRLLEFNQYPAPGSEGEDYRYDVTCFDSYDVRGWGVMDRKRYLVSLANEGAKPEEAVEWREVQGMAFANGVCYVANALRLADGSLWFSITATHGPGEAEHPDVSERPIAPSSR